MFSFSDFTEKLEEIEEAIHHCDFLSLDAEFTGNYTCTFVQYFIYKLSFKNIYIYIRKILKKKKWS